MKKVILSAIFAGFLIFGGGIIPNLETYKIAYAQDDTTDSTTDYSDFEGIIPSGKGLEEGDKTKDLSDRIKNGSVGLGDVFIIIIKFIDLVTKFAGTIAVIFLIYGGYQYMIGGISDDKEGAKNTIKYAILGLIVTFMAYVIVNLVQAQFLGSYN